MADDKQKVFSLVPKGHVESPEEIREKKEYAEAHKKLIDRSVAGEQHMLLVIGDDGKCTFLTNMDLMSANFFLEKVKLEMHMQYDEEVYGQDTPDD